MAQEQIFVAVRISNVSREKPLLY